MEALEEHLTAQREDALDFFWHRLRAEAVSQRLPSGPIKLLDVGAGAGAFGEHVRRHLPTVEYHFVEKLDSLEAALCQRFGADRNARALRDYRIFDVLVLLDVLEHQEDDREFCRQLLVKMRPGARLILTVPAMQWLWSAWDAALGHVRRYTRGRLRRAFEGLPARWVECSYLFPEMVPLALARKVRLRGNSLQSADEAHFPSLPAVVNETLYRLGRGSLALHKFAPVGTSVFGVVDVH
jgi:SAM-dependent methyltransferase